MITVASDVRIFKKTDGVKPSASLFCGFLKRYKKFTRIFLKLCTFCVFYDTMKWKYILKYADERSNVIFMEAGRVFFIER